ncbi:hypothetical protein C2E23DRAFT_884388 [Lenzites betulinus]|nr:hypothetical protein C2E23DRAFT_884388 [Lenzites betulinus]
MDLPDALLAEYLLYTCLALSSLLAIYVVTSQCLWKMQRLSEVDYAFSASTVVRSRPPTVLQFSARVPPVSGAAPLILRTMNAVGQARLSGPRGIKEEDNSSRPVPKGILLRSTSAVPARNTDAVPPSRSKSIGIPTRSASIASTRNEDASPSLPSSPAATSPLSSARRRVASSVPLGLAETVVLSEDDRDEDDGGNSAQRGQSMPAAGTRCELSSPKITVTRRITRSSSRASLPQDNVICEASTSPSIETLVKLKRNKNTIRGNDKHDTSLGRLYTWWFETISDYRITAPPPLHTSCGLQRGDVFWHKSPGYHQFWLRVWDETQEEEGWQAIPLGHQRADGRLLTITPKEGRLSWVGGDWGSRRVTTKKKSLL